MEQFARITFSSSIENLCETNGSFSKGVLKIAYVGENRNKTSISKAAFENAIPTMFNCPIVCNYVRDNDGIGGHDSEVVMKDGKPTLVNMTQPVGVVPESARYWWQTIADKSGDHEYLCTEVLLWKRQEAYQKIKENGITDQSMEIKIKDGHSVDNVYVIDSFDFLAFCLLERDEPCFESASLELFALDGFKAQYAKMLEELRNDKEVASPDGVEIEHAQSNSEGGKAILDKKMELLAKYGFAADQLNFEYESMTDEDFEAKLVEFKAAKDAEAFALHSQFMDALYEALGAETVDTEWGKMCKYCFCDYDAEHAEVYAWDTSDWKLYGFTYAMNGDNVSIDFGCKKRKKFAVVDFDEGDEEFSFEKVFSSILTTAAGNKEAEVKAQYDAVIEETNKKFSDVTGENEKLNTEVMELRQYKEETVSKERASAECAVFAQFEELAGVEAFEALKTGCSNFTIQELEEKCYAIKGRVGVQNFSKKPGSTVLPIEHKNEHESDEPYGGLFVEFPPAR